MQSHCVFTHKGRGVRLTAVVFFFVLLPVGILLLSLKNSDKVHKQHHFILYESEFFEHCCCLSSLVNIKIKLKTGNDIDLMR